MNRVKFKVCSGPGCKAWDSLRLAQELSFIAGGQSEFEVELVSCMNSCGGGVSVRAAGNNSGVYKFRTVKEALGLIGDQTLVSVVNA